MNHFSISARSWLLTVVAAAAYCGCGSDTVSPPVDPPSSSGSGGQGTVAMAGTGTVSAGAAGSAVSASAGMNAAAGAPSSAGAIASGGSGVDGGAPAAGGGAPSFGGAGAVGVGGKGGSNNAAGSAGSAGAAVIIDPTCKLSSPVSFKQDIAPFLATSCGKGAGGGCHVTDSSSTVNSLCPDGTMKCGFSHAYDWITAGSHNEFCKQTPGPIRFTVVMAVVKAAKPATCTASRIMPPTGAPLTSCQMTALEAWLAEPQVLQTHRADDTSPAAPYLMPPFN